MRKVVGVFELEELEKALYDSIDPVPIIAGKANVDVASLCTPLHLAAVYSDVDAVNDLIAKGVNVNAIRTEGTDIYTIDDISRYTPLHLAAARGHIGIVNALIGAEGIDIGAVDGIFGYTPLHVAAACGHIEIVDALIKNGAKVNTKDKNGDTPLHAAAACGHIEIANALIGAEGIDIGAVDGIAGYTPLHVAAACGHIEIVDALIKNGAKVNTKDKNGDTPLHAAARYGRVGIVEILIAQGVDVNVTNQEEQTPLYLAAMYGHTETVNVLRAQGAHLLFGRRNFRVLKYLVELIKNDSSKKAGETQQKKEHVDDEYELLKYSFLLHRDYTLIDVIERDTLGNLICTWFADVSHLTQDQKKLNEKLLSILGGFLYYDGSYNDYVTKFESFLRENESNENLKNILNLKRGESQSTVLHVLSGIEDLKAERVIDLLLKAGTDPNIQNGRGETPIDLAINNHNYPVKEYFLTDEQKSLLKELRSACYNPTTKLEKLLDQYKNTQDLEAVLNLRDSKGRSQILKFIRNASNFFPDCKEIENLLLSAGAIDYEELDNKEHLSESGTLWDNLILNQQQELKVLLDKAQDVNQLEQIVNKVIGCGIRFNFSIHSDNQGTYNFTDYVIKRTNELEKNPKVASDIICKLVSKGTALNNPSSIDVINTLESEFEDHKTNMKKAHEECFNNTFKFVKIVKSAATGRVKNAKIDNSTFYLEYSEDSTINVAKITDGARNLGLTQGEIEYGRNIIRIGKSEVEIITANGIRHYTDLADGSDIVLTFSTSLGELEVNLYPDKQDKDKIIVEVSNKKEILEKFKNCKEKLGENCSLGGLVYNAIEQGYFEKSGKLRQSSEKIGLSKKISEEVIETVKGLQCGNIVNSSLSNVLSPEEVIKKIKAC